MQGERVPSGGSASTQVERRQLTIMFCDIVDSTELSRVLDPEDLSEIIGGELESWRSTIAAHGGFVARYMGDGLLAYFGYPASREDDAERAAYAGLEIAAAARERRQTGSAGTAVRVGIATGLVVVGTELGEGVSRETAAFGLTPNLAARLQALAVPNTVAISEETFQLLRAKFECDYLGEYRLKGSAAPVRAWQVLQPRPSVTRFAARRSDRALHLVGRAWELQTLRESWFRACGGTAHLVTVLGEAGIGKSHLCEAFIAGIAEHTDSILRWQCSSHHSNTPFHPLVEELKAAAGFSPDDADAVRVTKLERLLRQWTENPQRLWSAFTTFLSTAPDKANAARSVDGREMRKSFIDGLVGRLRRLSERQPVVALFEDAHWSDPSSLELLGVAMEALRKSPVLLLVTTRPEPRMGWSVSGNFTQLALSPLSTDDADAMVRLVSAGRPLEQPVVERIVSQSGGVPLFLEELARSAMDGDGAGDGKSLAVPMELRDLLASRLDALGPAKRAAQLAAAVGKNCPYRLLARLWNEDEEALRSALDAMQRAGLIVPVPVGKDLLYTFRHELIREAAYESLLKTARQALHLEIARLAQDEAFASSDARPELVAHHYAAAGLAAKAISFWLDAARRALRESANREAQASLWAGLQALAQIAGSEERVRLELRLQCLLGQALIAIHGHASAEVHQCFARAYELCEIVPDAPELFPVLWGITAHHLVKGDIRSHGALSARLVEAAQASGDPDENVIALTSRILSKYFAGELVAGREYLERFRALYDARRHAHLAFSYAVDRKVIAFQFGAWILWTLGYPDQAAALEQELNEHARRLGHPNSLAQALTGGASVYLLRREPERLLARVREGIALAQAQGYPVWVDHGGFWVGWALAEQGELEKGISSLEGALVAYRKGGAGSSLPKFLALLADRLGQVGRHAQGLGLLNEAIAHIERWGERVNESEAYRLRGKLEHERRGPAAEAERDLRRAMDIARAQQARGWELRAATSLASFLRDQGRRHEAVEALAPVYEWFCEGLDTPDLKQAGALLKELR